MIVNDDIQKNFENAMEQVYELSTNEEALCLNIQNLEEKNAELENFLLEMQSTIETLKNTIQNQE